MLIFGGAYIRRGLSTAGNLRFKTHWASHIVGSKFTGFALLYFIFEGNFPSTSPRGAYIWRGDSTEGFLRCRFGGLIFGGAYFRNFTVVYVSSYVLPRERVTRITRSKGNPNVLHLTIKHVRLILFKAFFQTDRKNNGHSRK